MKFTVVRMTTQQDEKMAPLPEYLSSLIPIVVENK